MPKITNNGGLKDLPHPKYKYITSTEEAFNHLESIEKHPIIEIDTETTGLDPFIDKVVLLQIGVHGQAYIFDVRDGRVDGTIFKPLLEGTKNLKLLQNAVFDCKMLKTNFGIEINRLYDTMIAEQLMYLGLNVKSNLQHLVAKYLHLNMPKDVATSFNDYNQKYQEYQLRYAANDVVVLKDIYNLQLNKLKQDGLMRVAQLEFDFIKPLVEMELNGMLLDVIKWREILDEMTVERDKLRIQLADVFNKTLDQNTLFGVSLLNLDSPIQIVKCLNDIGIPVESTDVKELNKYKDNSFVKLLLDYRKYEKFITTYGEPMIERIHPVTKRLHTNFKQMVGTGRLSSSNPNLQNIPKKQKYRSCFIARPGYKLITCMAADSIILTEKGPKKIEDIKINDKVFTHKNRYKKVINISKQLSDHIYEIKIYYNSSVYKITGNHPLLTLENDSFKWKPVNKFNKNDIVCFPIDNTVVDNNIIESLYVNVYKISDNKKIGQRRFKREHLLNKDFWRLVGYWIGDGHRTMYNSFLSFNIKDKKKCIEDVHEISKNLFGIDPGYRRMPGCVEIRIPEKNLSHFVSQFYINGNRGLKKLNPIIEHLPLNLQKELIIGYFRADGHYYSGRNKSNLYNYAGFVSVSKQVLESIQRILLRFGIITSIQKVRNAGKDKIMGRAVNVKDKYELIGGKYLVDFLGIEAKYIPISKINYNEKASKISEENRYGYCKCGCGKKTTIFRGKPRDYIHGHNGRGTSLSYEHRSSMSKTFFEKRYNHGKTKGFFKNDYFCFPIKSIVKVNWQKPVFNLEVEDDHSYCLHLLTTHNCDMSAAELRIIANLSKDPLWVKIFNEGGDLHTVSAAGIYGISEEEVIADKQLPDDDPNKRNYRNNSKPISFGLAYGLSAVGLSLRLGISKDEAQKMINNYFKKYPAVHRFLESSGKKAVLNRFSTSISGRRRYYRLPDPTDPNFNKIKGMVERQGKNMPIQSSNADTIKQAMVYIIERIKPYDARLILTVHDEVVVEAEEHQAAEVADIVSKSVCDGFDTFFDLVKMKADADIADYWIKG